MKLSKGQAAFGLMRIGMGWIFFWAFIDKLFGLGFATAPDKSWLAGNSPTSGFLKFATKGPLAGTFQSMAGQPAVDWLFMLGLLLIGLAFILGIGVRIAGWSAALLMSLMFLAAMPPTNNPAVDEHIIYALAAIGFALSDAGVWLGFGRPWSETRLVKRFPFLR